MLPDGPHLHDAHGHVDMLAFAVFVDIALGTAVRLEDAYREHQATIYLQLQLTGIPAPADIAACARPRGGAVGTRVEYSISEATLETGGGTVCHATGTFAGLDAPRGIALGPLP